MQAKDYWQLFWETGAPEAYLSYIRMIKTEDPHVLDDSGYRPEGDGL